MPTLIPSVSVEPHHSAASVTGFTCGLLSIITCGFIFLALPLALIGMQQSKKGWHESHSPKAKRGYHLSIFGLIFTLVIYLVGAAIISLSLHYQWW